MNSFHRVRLFLQTARHMQSGQLLSRVRRSMRRSLWKAINKRAPNSAAQSLATPLDLYSDPAALRLSGPWDEQVCASVRHAEALNRGEFCFLNHRIEFGSDIQWHDPHLSRLWLYHLHYFDYVRDLLVQSARDGSAVPYQTFRSTTSSWIEHNELIQGNGWHPYTISIRLVNWLKALSCFASRLAADPEFDLRLRQSLSAQAQILATDLETDVRGNHLIANLRALIFWGLITDHIKASRWLQRSLRLLGEEIAEQVPADGGHFERSPGYHCVVLEHCLEIALCLQRHKATVPSWLDGALKRMLGYLTSILPSSGELPLLKDTTWDAPSPRDLLAAGALYLNDPRLKGSEGFGLYPLLLFGREGWHRFRAWPVNDAPVASRELPESCHCVMRDDSLNDHLIFDAGKPCPDYLPAHAHADLLSYELRVSGERIVVDSGVYEYAEGAWRDYFRSTRAHNTVELAGTNQSEVWSSFRVARRARPGRVLWLNTREYTLAQSSHDGYMRLAVHASHRRTLVWKPNQYWLILDEISGAGGTRAVSYLHLHPRLDLERVGSTLWQIHGAGSALWIAAFSAQSHTVIRGQMEPTRQAWYSERFGELSPNCVLALETKAALPFCFGYVIFKGSPGSVEFHPGVEMNRIRIVQSRQESCIGISRDGTAELK